MSAREKSMRASPPPRPLLPRAPATMASLRSSPAPRLAAPINRSSPSSAVASVTPRLAKRRQEDDPSPATPVEATPVKTAGFNVTPRSSARRARVSSISTTPVQAGAENGNTLSPLTRGSRLGQEFASPRSPAGERTDSDVKRRVAQTTTYPPTLRPILSPTLSASTRASRTSEHSSTFFYAGDGPPKDEQQRPKLQQKTSSFVYANGRRETGLGIASPTAIDDPQKFNGVLQGPRSPQQPNGTDSPYVFRAGATTPRKTTSVIASENGPASPGGFAAIATRSPSPTKFDFHLSYRKGASQVIRPPISNHASSSSISSPGSKRRVSSLDTVSEQQDNGRRTSTSSISSTAAKQSSPRSARPPASRKSSLTLPLNSVAPARPTSLYQTVIPPAVPDTPLSESIPTPSTEQPSDNPHLSTTARARHERKVLDLEISNSSLLAINRTLEREVRKQKTELRRLRRVTRSNARTSWLSDGTSMGGSVNGLPSLDELAAGGDAGVFGFLNLTGASNSYEDGEDDDDASDIASTTLSGSSGTRSPTTLARDQKRLRLDLTRHRELLVDSQRMNVSLKRCLGMTEMLMKEGSKALDYTVGIGDVELGGRVLSPEEVDGEEISELVMNGSGAQTDTDEEEGVYGGERPESVLRREAFEYFDEAASARESMRRSREGQVLDDTEPISPRTAWQGPDEMVQMTRLNSSSTFDEGVY